MMKLDQLKAITELNAVPGNESQAREFVAKALTPFADKVEFDNLGSVVGVKVGNPKGPKIYMSGHLDEVGFMVSAITKEGFLKVLPLGGWWSQVVLAQQMTITTQEGKTYRAVVGSRPPHILSVEERKQPVDLKDIFLDLGVKGEEKIKEMGIQIGDMVTPYTQFQVLADENVWLAKAWDNRIGCAIMIDVAENLKNESIPSQAYYVATVQEEVGLRGARTSANMVDPDIAFGVDVTVATDYLGGDKDCNFGEGPAVLVYDGGLVGHRGLRKQLMKIAKKHNIPVQLTYLNRGTTDAGAAHLAHAGAPAMSLGIPSRYIHSHTSMIHKQDYEYAVKLLTEFVKACDWDMVNEIKND